jgi:hypothetical protein
MVVAGLLSKIDPITMLSNEMKMLAKKAVQNVATLKPLIIQATSKIINALITRINTPKVSRVSGKVRTISSGLMTAFAKPSKSADAIKDEARSNFSPLKIKLATQSERAVMPQCRRKGLRFSSISGDFLGYRV